MDQHQHLTVGEHLLSASELQRALQALQYLGLGAGDAYGDDVAVDLVAAGKALGRLRAYLDARLLEEVAAAEVNGISISAVYWSPASPPSAKPSAERKKVLLEGLYAHAYRC